MKRLEKESGFCLHSREESEKAFRQWVQHHIALLKIKKQGELYLKLTCKHFPLVVLDNRWLRRKRTEKRAEQQAARERSRRLVLEERRARRMHDLLCTVNEIKPFRFSDPCGYHYWSPCTVLTIVITWIWSSSNSAITVVTAGTHSTVSMVTFLSNISKICCLVSMIQWMKDHVVRNTNRSSLLLIFYSSFFSIQRSNRCSSGCPWSNSFRHLK